MPSVKCPNKACKQPIYAPDDFADIIVCDKCGQTVYVVLENGLPKIVRLRKLDLDIPRGLPDHLQAVLQQAIACFDIDCHAATVVLAGLFLEGFLTEIGLDDKCFVKKIEKAHALGAISTVGYHMASFSRLSRNSAAHYSPELAKLSSSDAKLALEATCKVAEDILLYLQPQGKQQKRS